MKKNILIHIHIYYLDQWQEFKELIMNFASYDNKLFITLPSEHKFFEETILNDFPEAEILIFDNKGYDIAPFIEVINRVDLSDYAYIAKLHTKKVQENSTTVNSFDMTGEKWREYLLKPFVAKEYIEKIIEFLDKNKKVAMHADYHLIVSRDKSKRAKAKFNAFIAEKGLQNINLSFVAGTMFIAKAEVFKSVQNLKLCIDDFSSPQLGEPDFAHVMERYLGYCVHANSFEIRDVLTPKFEQFIQSYKAKIIKIIYENYHTDKKHIIKICRIPVYLKKF